MKNLFLPSLMLTALLTAGAAKSNAQTALYPQLFPLTDVRLNEGPLLRAMQLNDSVTLVDKDYKQWPFNATDKKELRALVSVIFNDKNYTGLQRDVHIVNVLDTIRTKPMSPIVNDMEKVYGDDPVEILDSWKTVCEDGYLTLHFRTLFGGMKIHTLRLVRQADGTLRLFHDANGDAKGAVGDGIIAFRLNDVPKPEDGGKYENITLKWNSFSGEKSHTFKYKYRE